MTPFSVCARVQDQLPWFVGDDLDDAAAEPVRTHLRDCPRCRAEASSLLQARRALLAHAETAARSIDDAQFAAWHEEIVAAVARDGERAAAPASTSSAAKRIGARGTAAAAALLVGLGYLGSLPSAGLLTRAPIFATTEVRPAPRMQPLGQDAWLVPASHLDMSGPGMMGRLSLRTLEDETLPFDSWVLPVPPRRPDGKPR